MANLTSLYMSLMIVQLPTPKAMLFTRSFLRQRPITPIFDSKLNKIKLKKIFLATVVANFNKLLSKCLVQCVLTNRTCGENLSQIRPPVPEKSALLRKNFQKVIQLVGITSSSCPL